MSWAQQQRGKPESVDLLGLDGFWETGSVKGLRARGDVTVDTDWVGGTPT